MKRLTLAVLLAATLAAYAHADPVPTVTLIPADGSVSGAPGTAVGWGFTLTDTSADWVVLTGSEFTGSPVYGTYVDYLSLPTAPLYVAGPAPESSVVTQAWNPSSAPPLGVGEFDINSTAPPLTQISGDIVIHYSVFSGDPNNPNFDPDTETVVADATLSDPAKITVTTVTPEPSFIWPLSVILLACAFARWQRRRVALTA